MRKFLSILITFSLLVSNLITPSLALASTHDQPVTTASFSSAPDFEGKYPNPVTVTLSATAAPGYLISQTYYTLDGGSQQTYTAPFTVSGSGSHTITYWSVDNAGLGEDPHKSQTITLRHQGIHIDSAEWVNETTVRFHYSQNTYAPASIGLVNVLSDGSYWSGAAGWSSSQESGYVDFVAREHNDLYWGAESGYTRYWALVGGDFSDRSNIIRLPAYVAPPHDQPVTTATLSPEPLSNGEYPGSVTVSLSATAASGYAISQTYYTIDGGSQQTYNSPFIVSGPGNHTISYWSVDNAGLGEDPRKSQSFTIRQQTLHIDSAEWVNETTIRFHYSGNAHPGESIGLIFTLSDGTYHAGAFGWSTSQESGYVDFVARESNDLYWGAEAGYTRYYALTNAEGQSTNIIRLSAYVPPPHSQPVTTATFSSNQDSEGKYTNPVTVTLSATAAPGFAISQTYYTLDGGSQQTYTAPFTVGGSGDHTITYWSVDNAGLGEDPHKSQTFTLQHEGIHIDSAEWISETTIRFHYSQNTYAPGPIGLNFVLSDGSFHAGAFGWSSSQESGYVDFVAREYNDLYWGAEAGYTRYYAITGGDFADKSNIIRLPAYVPPSNQAPFLDPIGNKTVAEGQTLQFTVSAIDPDGDSLIYSAANLPPGATFNPFTRVFTWTPNFIQEGNYTNIEFTVTDGGTPMELDTELITITVGNVNRAPVFDSLGSQEVLEEQLLTFTVDATDPDGDTFILLAENLPSGSSFDSQSGTFSWTPTLSQAGNYVVTFKATDNGTPFETGTLDVAITIGDNPTPTEQADNITTTIVTYDFPTNVENSYLSNLKKVAAFIEQGKIQPAINQLNAFIGKVNEDYANGEISQEEHDNLVNLAQALLNDLQ